MSLPKAVPTYTFFFFTLVVGEFKVTAIPLKWILRNEVLPSYKNAGTLCNEKKTFQIMFTKYTKIQQTKMLVMCQRFGDLFLFGLVWQYSTNQNQYNRGTGYLTLNWILWIGSDRLKYVNKNLLESNFRMPRW